MDLREDISGMSRRRGGRGGRGGRGAVSCLFLLFFILRHVICSTIYLGLSYRANGAYALIIDFNLTEIDSICCLV